MSRPGGGRSCRPLHWRGGVCLLGTGDSGPGSPGRPQTLGFFGQLCHGSAWLSGGVCKTRGSVWGAAAALCLACVLGVCSVPRLRLASPAAPAPNLQPSSQSPCSCPASATSVWPQVPLGPNQLPWGGAVTTKHSRWQRLGAPPSWPDPGTRPGGGPGAPALLCRPHVRVRVRMRVVCPCCALCIRDALCFWAKRPACPGALSSARHPPRRDLSLGQPLEHFGLDPRARVVCAPAAWRQPHGPVRLGLGGWPSGAMPTSRPVLLLLLPSSVVWNSGPRDSGRGGPLSFTVR